MNKVFTTTIMFISLFTSIQSYAMPVWVSAHVDEKGNHIEGHWRSDPRINPPSFSPATYNNYYGYEVWVYRKGKSLAYIRGQEASCGRGKTYLKYSIMHFSAQQAINDCKKYMYKYALSKGWTTDQAILFISRTLIKDNCKFIGFKKDTFRNKVFYRETMICFVPPNAHKIKSDKSFIDLFKKKK